MECPHDAQLFDPNSNSTQAFLRKLAHFQRFVKLFFVHFFQKKKNEPMINCQMVPANSRICMCAHLRFWYLHQFCACGSFIETQHAQFGRQLHTDSSGCL